MDWGEEGEESVRMVQRLWGGLVSIVELLLLGWTVGVSRYLGKHLSSRWLAALTFWVGEMLRSLGIWTVERRSKDDCVL